MFLGLGIPALIIAVVGSLAGLGIIQRIITNYHKVPPNKAMVIYGRGLFNRQECAWFRAVAFSLCPFLKLTTCSI